MWPTQEALQSSKRPMDTLLERKLNGSLKEQGTTAAKSRRLRRASRGSKDATMDTSHPNRPLLHSFSGHQQQVLLRVPPPTPQSGTIWLSWERALINWQCRTQRVGCCRRVPSYLPHKALVLSYTSISTHLIHAFIFAIRHVPHFTRNQLGKRTTESICCSTEPKLDGSSSWTIKKEKKEKRKKKAGKDNNFDFDD